MSPGGVQMLALVVPTVVAGTLMIRAGTQKKLLEWRSPRRRCPACGRSGRHDCS